MGTINHTRNLAELEALVLSSVRMYSGRMNRDTVAQIAFLSADALWEEELAEIVARALLEWARADRALDGGDIYKILDRDGQAFVDKVIAKVHGLVLVADETEPQAEEEEEDDDPPCAVCGEHCDEAP